MPRRWWAHAGAACGGGPAAVRAYRSSFVWSLATLALPRSPHCESGCNCAAWLQLVLPCRLVNFFSACLSLSPLHLLLINSSLSRALCRSHSRIVCGEGLADVGGCAVEGFWRTFIK